MCAYIVHQNVHFFRSERENYSSVPHREVWEYISLAFVALKDNFPVTDAATGNELRASR